MNTSKIVIYQSTEGSIKINVYKQYFLLNKLAFKTIDQMLLSNLLQPH